MAIVKISIGVVGCVDSQVFTPQIHQQLAILWGLLENFKFQMPQVSSYIQYFPYSLFVSNSQVIGCEDCLQHDLYCRVGR